jgi:hypothetical protein
VVLVIGGVHFVVSDEGKLRITSRRPPKKFRIRTFISMSPDCGHYIAQLLELRTEFVDLGGDLVEFGECFRNGQVLTASQTSLCRYILQHLYSMWYPNVEIDDILEEAEKLVECIPDFDDYEKVETAWLISRVLESLPRREISTELCQSCMSDAEVEDGYIIQEEMMRKNTDLTNTCWGTKRPESKGMFVEFPDYIEEVDPAIYQTYYISSKGKAKGMLSYIFDNVEDVDKDLWMNHASVKSEVHDDVTVKLVTIPEIVITSVE